MLQIPCPHCGIRDETEYSFGGPAHVTRPAATVADAEWTDYLFNRDNPKGIHYERWCHSFGCGRWFNLVRDTVTHDILGIYPMGASKRLIGDLKPALNPPSALNVPPESGAPNRP
jgi:sarcosine oxidase subunit delta